MFFKKNLRYGATEFHAGFFGFIVWAVEIPVRQKQNWSHSIK